MSILSKIFGTKNDRELKRMHKSVALVNALESEIESLSDEQLAAKTQEFKQRVEQGESLDKLLVEAFAVVREAGKRSLGMRHFDSQLVGGITLHEGRIAEMRTGEGKTLVATLPAYLNALTGNSVHLVTVNDYLAKRDAGWMAPLYEKLGLSVGVVVPGQDGAQKRDAYLADIVYGTNNEFGFDYLRDNMAFSVEEKVQRRLAFAVIDEVDSILIDEARTPLIISGAVEDSSAQYKTINRLIPLLNEQEFVELTALDEKPEDTGHFIIDEKQRSIELTEMGHEYVEGWLGQEDLIKPGESLYAGTNLSILHHVHAALKAHKLFLNDDHYIIQDGQVVIIDENTGRAMPGRRWSEGIHQAIEAKEGLNIQNESQTLASTTFQNYFRLYDKLSGMTGTADTEAFEFKQIYGLDVVLIPTNKPMVRDDQNDLVYLSMAEKYEAIADYIEEIREKNAPVLVGTASIESSELLSKLLKQKKVPHSVLNAKFHEKEASIIAQAGTPGTVTIATNMAGRGTDIVLGGNWEFEAGALKNPTQKQRDALKAEWQKSHDIVLAAGGLHVIGSERHESRRIDNQLRGRSGRQGDPGLTRFFLSLEDNLMRIFASDRVRNLMQRMGMEHGEAIEARMVNNAIEKAQRKVEGRNFDIRKQLLEYDDVANDQRQVIYQQRNELMESDDISDAVNAIRYDVINDMIDGYIPPQSLVEQWDIEGLTQELKTELGAEYPIAQWLENDKELYEEPLREKILKSLVDEYAQKEEQVGEDIRVVEKQLMLQILDSLWKEHLAAMDHLRQGIHLRAYAQKKPQQEYKRESFELFQDLLSNMKHELVKVLTRVQIRQEDEAAIIERQRRDAMAQKMQFQHAPANALAEGEPDDEGEPEDKEDHTPFVRRDKKVGRNDICPCGSGKKFKQCHGKLA